MSADQLIEIFVNTKPYNEPKGKISYARLVEIAYPDFAKFPNATYSIIYEHGQGNAQATLDEGESVEIVKGMSFRVKRTGES
ncbi:MAG TPA: multiubiquitin domain-containing protein [Gammaproteobacteria bacterium]|nr:multiubiquitin domain-containing protein [Gammaproteobacteria bacterium]